ncbi:MAG: insulinase family protein [Bacteroidales bacterium]|nr:insulinase family protein [Bacteroidales bacterium]
MFFSKIKILIVILLLAVYAFIKAEQCDTLSKLMPVDGIVRIGKLENGFTYYIRKNTKPENRVEMHLAVNAGSILEEEDQLGIAHFVEHMCFNGTKHFEKNEMVEYLQSIGMRFGAEVNAFTSFDETVYMLTIPTDSAELMDKGFLMMEDWAHNVSFDEEEIDKERGVIIEEWRLGRGPWQRMRDKYLPVIFKDSRYAERLPIGKKEIIENCSYETVSSFYLDWYRPDLMALIVVGDIDPDRMEEKIQEHFAGISLAKEERERTEYDVPDNIGTLISITTDVEAPASLVRLFYKTDAIPVITQQDYLNNLQYSFLSGMINRRLAELAENENPPYIGANYFYGSLGARTKDALQGYAIVGEKGIERGLLTLLTENERILRYGFTPGEFERYKLDLLNRYEAAYNERDKTESKTWAGEYVAHFLDNEPIPGIEFEFRFLQENIDEIKLEGINSLAQQLIKNDNRIIVINAPENDSIILPDEQKLLALASSVVDMDIEPYTDEVSGKELLTEVPEPSKIVSEIYHNNIEAYELHLSNGAKVILKPTDFKNDQILLSAFSLGGHSVYPDEDHFTALNTDGIIQESGVAEYSNTELSKLLAGKTVYVAPSVSYSSESITARAKASDIESMFQLIYLYFTDPRKDESAFNSFLTKKKELYANLSKDPENYFFDKYYRIRAQDHPRGNYLPKAEDWDKVNYERALEIYSDRFADAGNFTFVIIGKFSIDTVKTYLKQYIGSLPTIDRSETYIDLGIRPPGGKEVHNIYLGSDPKSLALLYFEKEKPWNRKDAFLIDVLGEILGYRYIEVLREEMSGVYTSRASAALQKIPYEKSTLQILIPCAPENVDSLVQVAVGELKKIQDAGVEEKDLNKARESRKRQLEENLKKNGFWLSAIQEALINDLPLDNITDEQYMNSITSDELKRVANEYFDANNSLQVVLYPEEYKELVNSEQ